VVVDVGPEIEAGGAQRIREFASTLELSSPDEFLERAVKFNPLRNPAVLRRSLFYHLRQLPSGKFALKHDQRRASEEPSRISTGQRERLSRAVTRISCPTLIVRGALSDVLSDRAAEKFANHCRTRTRAGSGISSPGPLVLPLPGHRFHRCHDRLPTVGVT
jgi:hypothetical protein